MEKDEHKHDSGKPRWDLLPLEQVAKIVDILTFGAEKYSVDGWKDVPNGRDRYFAAMMRHLVAQQNRETIDFESGQTHLAHAACCLMFLMWLEDHPERGK